MNCRNILFVAFSLLFSVCGFAAEQNQAIWQSKPVEHWTKILASALEKQNEKAPSVREQWYAAYSLGKYAKEAESAVPVLLERLQLDAGEDDDVRACILLTLALIGDKEAVPAILKEVDSEYPIMRRTAVLALRKFPKELAEDAQTVEKLEQILKSHAETEQALATNCAAALWLVGKQDAVLAWIGQTLTLDKEFNYVRNTEIYQTLAAIHLILEDSGPETFGENAEKLGENLVELVQKTPDADSALSACEILVKLGPAALPSVQKVENIAKKPRLLSVLAALDSENPETQTLVLATVEDSAASLPCRIAAIRGTLHFPEAQRPAAADVLVKILNEPDTDPVIANEARLTLKKLGAANK
ncbi:MAG: HEAT repeat domain-containing protein [Thermoguttaceae bacterium]|nr:HEAT repeat domain-containing protein [Thermoguttaceae bacterium]MBR0191919.1 HEAT repeat domain-containing protein [Thermoguttaceae bacterium]